MVAAPAGMAGTRAVALAVDAWGGYANLDLQRAEGRQPPGDGWVWFGALLGAALAGGNTGASAAIRLFAVGVTDLVLYRIIKRWIARPRPAGSGTGIIERVRPLDMFSFPSGHVMHAVACSVVLTAYYPMAAAVVWPLTILIALSRVILGLHYPSDVVAGAALGATVALMSFNLL